MNNQAAQTMPELPEPTMRELNPYHGSRIDPYAGATHLQWYTAAQMHQYARDYAAMLAAAPAASGGDDAFRREWKNRFGFLATNNPPDSIESIDEVAELLRSRQSTPPAAASVSERARGYRQHDAIEFALRDAGFSPDDAARITEVVEQALTQQRGDGDVAEYQIRSLDPYSDVVFFGWKKITKNEYDLAERQAAMSSNELTRIELRKLYTTPQPSADAVRELVKRWRDRDFYAWDEAGPQEARENCADELESLLGRGAE